jgi:hypothetical protein
VKARERATAPQELEPGGHKVLIERECVCQPVTPHDFEADRVGDREILI